MTGLTIRQRLADLQVPIGQAETLSLAAVNLLDSMGEITERSHREAIGHVSIIVGLIGEIVARLRSETDGIERDAPLERAVQS